MFTDLADIIGKTEARAQELGLSIEDVCHEAGVHRSLWQKWKHGKHEPSFKSMRRIWQTMEAMGAPSRGAA